MTSAGHCCLPAGSGGFSYAAAPTDSSAVGAVFPKTKTATERNQMPTAIPEGTIDDYTGHAGCPDCGGGDGRIINVGKGHWAYCTKHRTKWMIGANLFSTWRHQTEAEQRAIYREAGIGDFENVTALSSAGASR